MYFVREIELENKHFYNQSLEPFQVIGRLKTTFKNDHWSYEEELFDQRYMKSYKEEYLNLDDIINSYTKTIYFAIKDNEVVGQIVIREHWNKCCYVDDLVVRQADRGNGVGSLLIQVAEAWAKENHLQGMMLETQDINLGACRCYIRNGYEIGGVDKLLYAHCDTHQEQAIFWYKKL